MPNDEVVDIIVYGLPKSWLKEMDKQDFDPFRATLVDLLAFCERLEAAEDHEGLGDTKPASIVKSNKKSKTSKNTPRSGKWCDYHETDTHNTSECKTLKRLKAQRKNGDKPFGNKTWKR